MESRKLFGEKEMNNWVSSAYILWGRLNKSLCGLLLPMVQFCVTDSGFSPIFLLTLSPSKHLKHHPNHALSPVVFHKVQFSGPYFSSFTLLHSLHSNYFKHRTSKNKSAKLCESHIIKTSHEVKWMKLTTIQSIISILRSYTELNHGEKKSTKGLI